MHKVCGYVRLFVANENTREKQFKGGKISFGTILEVSAHGSVAPWI
jgi:hypothetical protein